MGSKTKPKATTFSPVTQVLNANLSNSTFGFLPAVGWKGKSPASASRSVNLQPDLDLLSGFAFLSFASLDELETHIDRNEAKAAALSVNVGQKRKPEASDKPQGDNFGLYAPQSKKKAVSAKKKPVKKTATLTTDAAAKPKQSLPKSKPDKVSSVGTILDEPELSRFTPIDVSARRSEINEQSSNVFSEISLLCSEIVDLGDDEDSEEIFKSPPPKAVADSTNRDVGDGRVGASTATNASTAAASESVVEGDATASESIPKKKKKKKRKNEHCDQTSQTKFRIKKKKKSESKRQDLEGSPDAMLIELKNAECLDLTLEDVENSQCEGGNGENSSQAKSSLSRPTIEKVTCARTAGYQGCAKGSSFKTKLYASESSSGGRLIDLTDNTSSSELAQAKMVEKISLDGCMPNSSDREIDVGDESVLSDLSDHSSDIEIDPCSCFLLNNKIDKVEKEELQEGEDIVDVDVETVGKETSKNFLVVSGVEAGHFSYHPGMTKEGTIDTSIQALPNEIDIFLQCAKMQEGEMIKIINPDDSDELHSHFTQKNGRNPETVKATRSATERKRRHHLGDLFSDMKLAVYNFTDLVDADLYLSKQAILSKGIGTIEDLEKESREMNNAKRQLTKTNKKLEEKRNMLLFGKPSVDVDSAKVEDIFNHLNINVDEEEIVKTEENANSNEDVAVDAAEKSKVVVEPSVKGRPRAKKTLLSPWVANNTPVPKNKDDLSSTAADLHPKTSTNNTLETSKEILGTSASSSQTLPAVHISNVSCGVQTLEVEKDAVKSFTLGNPTISFSSIEKDSSKSFTLGNPTISFSSVEKDSSKSFTLGNPPVSLPSDSHAAKATPLSESTSQEGSKASLPVKILPKPTILHLQSVNPTQQKAIMDTLGQVKQPSSDKIICNLSRLSTQQNPNKPSSICIIRSGQLMKSLDSKNVMHIKITNDALKKVDSGSSSTTSASTSQSSQQVSNTTMATRVPGFLTLGVAKVPEAPGTSRAQTLQKRPENTVLVSQIPLKSTTTPSAKVIFSGKPFGMLTSISNTGKSQSTSQASSEMTLRALASLSQLQANKPPLMGTTTKPVGFNENPVAGVLPGLKNVVMKVVPARPVVQSTTSVLQFLPTATVTTAFKGATSSHVTVTSSQGKCPTSTKGPTISVIPVISVPSSSSLNSSFTTSALNSPILSSGINTLPTATMTTAAFKGAVTSQGMVTSSQGKCPTSTSGPTISVIPIISVPRSLTVSALNTPLTSGISAKIDTSTQLTKACLDPFNLVPKQPAASNPPVTLKPDLPSTSIDLGTELNNLLRSESSSPTSDYIFEEEPSTTDDIFQEPSSSSTVLTQEMLKIPGIEQSPDVPLANLPEVFENLIELDKTTDAVKSPETSCDIEDKKPEGSDVCGVSSSSPGSRIQADVPVPSLSVRSPSVGAKTPTNPLKVEIKDFRKGTTQVKKETTPTELE